MFGVDDVQEIRMHFLFLFEIVSTRHEYVAIVFRFLSLDGDILVNMESESDKTKVFEAFFRSNESLDFILSNDGVCDMIRQDINNIGSVCLQIN